MPFFSKSVKRTEFPTAVKYFGKKQKDIVDFSLGEPKDRPPASAIEAHIQAIHDGSNTYAPVQGLPELREKIAEKLLEKNKINTTPEEILVTGGASEGIAYSILTHAEQGDDIIIVEPSYPIVAPMVRFCGARPISLFLSEENEFQPDLEKLKELITSKTKMLAINTPHNPTGTVFNKKDLRAISEIFPGKILVDEVYENFTYGEKHHSLASFCDVPENIITVNSFSKTYCMCGYRVGYLHASHETINHMLKLKLFISTCTSNPAQKSAIAALEDTKFPEMMKEKFEERKNAMVSGLKSLGLPFTEPQGAFYVFPNVSEIGSDEDAFYLFKKAGVLTMPGRVFHERYKKNVRFSFVADTKEIKKGIEKLQEKGLKN
ncbi:MAG: pyridoxal phosphate-dependent aminotransferase [Candidatus Aenigmarchaeota archaeon]|nr:pyridoxal phosphate-dependent aminotransferase [Candidatus Aenigmarchaeota archaeon]